MRNFAKYFKGSSLLNLLGMTVAFAALYILLVQVHYDLGYNRQIKDVERVYIMATPSWFSDGQYQVNLNRPLQKAILEQAGMVDSWGVAYIGGDGKNYIRVGNGEEAREYQIGFSQLTRGALDVFGFNPVVGTFNGMEKDETVAISESAAKLMGVGVGDAIYVGPKSKEPMTIVAVYEDMPMNSDLNNIHALFCCYLETQSIDNYSEWSYHHFVKLNSPSSKEAFEAHAKDVVEEFWRARMESTPESVRSSVTQSEIDEQINRSMVTLLPFGEMYYNTQIYAPAGRSGNKTTTITLLVVAILIVAVTLINFVNFFFAQVPMRIKGVNTRKILGSSRGELVGKMMVESGVLVLISLCAAVAVVVLFKSSTYANLISCTLEFGQNIPVICMTIGAALLITLASSIYPALYATSFAPAMALKGCLGTSQKGKAFRYALVCFQFAISIAFVTSAMFVKRQHSFMMNYDMGFNREYLISTELKADAKYITEDNQRPSLVSLLKESPMIKDIAFSQNRMVSKDARQGWGRTIEGEEHRGEVIVDVQIVTPGFLEVMGIEITEGRNFESRDMQNPNGAVIYNETARRMYNLTMETQIKWQSGVAEVAGFCKDAKMQPLQYKTEPMAFYIYGINLYYPQLYIRTTEGADFEAVKAYIEESILKLAPKAKPEDIKVEFFDEQLGREYEKEKELTRLITVFSLISILIALMGVFGLVFFETQYRRREIALRRVHGAQISEILRMFVMQYARMVGVAFLFAVPVSYLIMSRWLEGYAYHIPLYWWVFALALLIVLAVTSAIVLARSWKAARENPVNALYKE